MPEFRALGEIAVVIISQGPTHIFRLEFPLLVWQVWWGRGERLLPDNQKVEPAS